MILIFNLILFSFHSRKMTGYLYCFENECMPGLLKIGYTDRTVEERLAEANASGTFGPPSDYAAIVFAKLVNHPREKEIIVHALLQKYGKNPKKEFFGRFGSPEVLSSGRMPKICS